MTIEREVTSAQTGWYVDPHTNNIPSQGAAADGMCWKYGTERACNLVGRYVTIFADYSNVTPPFEIALCSWGIMGGPVPTVEEEIIDPVPPTFAEDLQPSPVIFDEASSWVLP